MSPGTLLALQKAEPILTKRLGELQERLQAGEAALWPEFLQVVGALVALLPSLTPEKGGALLTTEQMAARLGVASKTLLKRKKAGEIRPAIDRGKFIRWSGRETL